MLQSRLNDDGSAFEDETNIIGKTIGFEGAGAIVPDQNSAKIYTFWPGQTEPGPEMEPRPFLRDWFDKLVR